MEFYCKIFKEYLINSFPHEEKHFFANHSIKKWAEDMKKR